MSRRPVTDELREFARLQVRAGLLGHEAQHREVRDAIAAELAPPDAGEQAAQWLGEAEVELRAAQESWDRVTDHDRLEEAFAALDALRIPVLQGVEDHWRARDLLEEEKGLRGVVWFTQPDVWHAIDEGMLEINLWHATGANAAPGDELLDEVIAVLDRHGLKARFDEGRIEVAAHWQRRI